MATEVETLIRSIGPDGLEVLTNLNDENTKETVVFRETSQYADGTPMSDNKLDPSRVLYIKKFGKFFERVLKNNTVDLGVFGEMDDYAPAFSAIWNRGAIAVGENSQKTYTIKTPITVVDNNIIAFMNGATIHVDTPHKTFAINQEVSNSESYSVSSISYGAGPDKYTNIVLVGIVPFDNGQLLKIFSPELVTGFNNVLKGEFIIPEKVIYSEGNTTLKVKGSLDYPYAANIKVAAIKKYRTEVNCTKIEGIMDEAKLCGFTRLRGSSNSDFYQVIVERLTYPCFQLEGCYATTVDDCSMYYGSNGIGGGIGIQGSIGYGVNDSASKNTKVVNSNFNSLRHAFTTGSSETTSIETTDYNRYGETNGTICSDNTATNCLRPFDTHPPGYNILFSNNNIDKSESGYTTRSRDTHIQGGTVSRCNYGAIIGAEGDNVYEPVTVTGLTVTHCIEQAIYVSTTSNFKPKVIVKGCILGGALLFRNTDYVLENNNVHLRVGSTWLHSEDSNGRGSGNTITIDSAVVNGIVFGGTGSYYSDQESYILPNAQTSIFIARAIGGAVNNVFITKSPITFIGAGPTTNTASSSESGTLPIAVQGAFKTIKCSWRNETLDGVVVSNKSSRFISLREKSSTQLLEIENRYINDDVITFSIDSITSEKTLSTAVFFPGTFAGQEMVLYNNSQFIVTLPAFNKTASKLQQKQTVSLVFTPSGWIYKELMTWDPWESNFSRRVAKINSSGTTLPWARVASVSLLPNFLNDFALQLEFVSRGFGALNKASVLFTGRVAETGNPPSLLGANIIDIRSVGINLFDHTCFKVVNNTSLPGVFDIYLRKLLNSATVEINVYEEVKSLSVNSFVTYSVSETWIEEPTGDYEGKSFLVLKAGTTAQRPTAQETGFEYFDTTLGKPIYWSNGNWVDATGANV